MKVIRAEFEKGVPVKRLYEKGADFRDHEYEVTPEEAAALLEGLSDPRDHLYLFASDNCHLDFRFDEARNLWVEIQDLDFWAISKIPNRDAAGAIIEIAHQGRAFDQYIPTTTDDWDAYGGSVADTDLSQG